MVGAAHDDAHTSAYETVVSYYDAVINQYLQSDIPSALDEAVAQFVAPVNSAFEHPESADVDVEGILWEAWERVIRAAGSAAEVTLARLVDLMIAIKGQGILTRDQGRQECVVWGGRVYLDLPMFGAQMREMWDVIESEPGEAWTNLNAFAAQLTAVGIDFSLYAIWTLRDALEEEAEDAIGRAELSATAHWFRYCGPVLASLALKRLSFVKERSDPARVGRLCRESGISQDGFTVERWEFWRSRLEVLAAGAGAEARTARVALDYMSACDAQIINRPRP